MSISLVTRRLRIDRLNDLFLLEAHAPLVRLPRDTSLTVSDGQPAKEEAEPQRVGRVGLLARQAEDDAAGAAAAAASELTADLWVIEQADLGRHILFLSSLRSQYDSV